MIFIVTQNICYQSMYKSREQLHFQNKQIKYLWWTEGDQGKRDHIIFKIGNAFTEFKQKWKSEWEKPLFMTEMPSQEQSPSWCSLFYAERLDSIFWAWEDAVMPTPDHGKARASWSSPVWFSKVAKLVCSPDLPFPAPSCVLRDKYSVVHTQECGAHVAPWSVHVDSQALFTLLYLFF